MVSFKYLFNLLTLLVLVLNLQSKAESSPADSIGTEKKGGKTFILHKVDAKETLYSISRKYKVEVDALRKINPEAIKGLSVGQVVLIPAVEPKAIAAPVVTTQKHKVLPRENLFSIAKKYNVTLDAIKHANPGWKSGLQVGQMVTIPTDDLIQQPIKEDAKNARTEEKPAAPAVDIKSGNEQATASSKATRTENIPARPVQISTVPPPASSTYKKFNESGFAEVMTNSQDGLKYLALHNTAPVGTIIQVRNEGNNQKIFVRVIGTLASQPVDKTILQLSPIAFERLGGKGSKIPVSLSYIP